MPFFAVILRARIIGIHSLTVHLFGFSVERARQWNAWALLDLDLVLWPHVEERELYHVRLRIRDNATVRVGLLLLRLLARHQYLTHDRVGVVIVLRLETLDVSILLHDTIILK